MHYFEMARTSRVGPLSVRNALGGMAPAVRRAVAAYSESLSGNVIIVPLDFRDGEPTVLKQIYKRLSAEGHRSGMRAAIIQHEANANRKCAYCDITSPNELDHYLPQGQFPEYAVSVSNLIPSCSECNRLKRDVSYGEGGSRYPHAYHDEEFHEPYLTASVEWDGTTPVVSYSLIQCSEMSDREFQGLCDQYRDLKLIVRFRREAQSELSEAEASELAATVEGRESLKTSARSSYRRMHKLYGSNHWKTALYAGLSASLEA